MDANKALHVAKKAALLGREILLDYFGHLTDVSEKNQAGLVSEADVAAEKAIAKFILSEFPDTTILGEEGSFENPGKGLDEHARLKGVWMIDPLDGTTNYVHKLPIYCVSIGLEYQGDLLVAACDIPALERTYSAMKGGGSFLNDQKLSVSQNSEMSKALLATGFSTYDHECLQEQLKIFNSVIGDVRGIRRVGSAVFDLCMVAEGVFDCYWEKNLSAWDTAAGALLVREAGGVVTTYENSHFEPFQKSILAGNPGIHKQMQARIQKIIQIK